jgi:hypothetical protein
MAVTAHWLEFVEAHSETKLILRASLVGFLHLPGTHTGERLAEALYFIIKCTGLVNKVVFFFALLLLLKFN